MKTLKWLPFVLSIMAKVMGNLPTDLMPLEIWINVYRRRTPRSDWEFVDAYRFDENFPTEGFFSRLEEVMQVCGSLSKEDSWWKDWEVGIEVWEDPGSLILPINAPMNIVLNSSDL